METGTLTYETKCRRCGNFEDWFFAEKTKENYNYFIIAITDYIQNPRSYRCKICDKHTVQDVVSYSQFNN